MVNLVKKQPVEALVAKLKAGKTISKEQVLRESMRFKLRGAGMMLTLVTSEKQGSRCRHSRNLNCYVAEVPALHSPDGESLSGYDMHPQPVLRCFLVFAIARASSNMDMSRL